MIKTTIIKSKKFWILAVVMIPILIWATKCLYQHYFIPGSIDALSVSSDGKYVISTDERELAVLWDIDHKTYKIIGHRAHIFSAYFIPGTDRFIWQNQDKTVFIEDVHGKLIKKFKIPYFIRSQVMTPDMKYYMFGDIGDGIHWCKNFHCEVVRKPDTDDPNEFLDGKPYNMDLTPDGKYVIGTDVAGWKKQIYCNNKTNCNHLKFLGVVLWDLHNGKPIRNYVGNVAKSYAIFSPDGKYIISGDEDSWVYVWDLKTGQKIFELWDLFLGRLIHRQPTMIFDTSHLIKHPKDLFGEYNIALKFIDKTHYLRFISDEHYVVLYDVKKPQPLKYLDLGTNPKASVIFYQLNLTIDTSYRAHILVTGKAWKNGIMVYKYDPKNQTLTKIWDAD